MSTASNDEVPYKEPALTLGDRIRKARRDAGLDQGDLAQACGVSRPLVSKWEHDRSVPDLFASVAIGEACHVSLGWLAGVPARSRCFAQLRLVRGAAEPEPSDRPPAALRIL